MIHHLAFVLGPAFLIYSLVLASTTSVGVPFVFLLVRARRLARPGPFGETWFALVNPAAYLLALGSMRGALGIRCGSHPHLDLLLAASLLLFWALRAFGGSLRREVVRRLVRATAWTAVMVGLWLLVADAARSIQEAPSIQSGWGWAVWWAMNVGALYLVPVHMLLHWALSSATPERFSEADFHDVAARSRYGLPVVVLLAAALLAFGTLHPTEQVVEARLMSQRELILREASARRLDPALLAALLEETGTEVTVLRAALEHLAMDLLDMGRDQTDPFSQMFDVSVGPAQIKATTLMAANMLATGRWSKSFRPGLVHLPDPRARIPGALPVTLRCDGIDAVREVLMGDGAVAAAAFVLELYALQWEQAEPRWSIRSRPEILATLYSLGFEHSHPKADPRSNDFGRRVLERYRSPFVQRNFRAEIQGTTLHTSEDSARVTNRAPASTLTP